MPGVPREPGSPPWGPGPGPVGPGAWEGWVGIERLAGRVFLPSPEDRGPLRAGEADALLEFARERAPRIYRAMVGLRERSPDRFRFRLEQAAPRLRHLKRVYELSPRLGELLERHARTMFDLEQLRRELGELRAVDRPAFEREVVRLRPLLAEMMTIELDALDALAGQLEVRFERNVEERVHALLSDEVFLEDKPPAIRALVAEIRAAEGTDAEVLRAQLHAAVSHHLRGEVEMLRRRAQDARTYLEVAIEHRFERNRRWLERPPGPPHPPSGGWRGGPDRAGPHDGPPPPPWEGEPRRERPGRREPRP